MQHVQKTCKNRHGHDAAVSLGDWEKIDLTLPMPVRGVTTKTPPNTDGVPSTDTAARLAITFSPFLFSQPQSNRT